MARKSQRLRRKIRIERMKAREQEARMSKNVQDNSVILERMKNMSSIIDEVCESITIAEPVAETKIQTTPVVEMKSEPSVEMKIQPHNEPTLIVPELPNFKKMTKKALLSFAKDNDIVVKNSMTKAQLIKAIRETI